MFTVSFESLMARNIECNSTILNREILLLLSTEKIVHDFQMGKGLITEQATYDIRGFKYLESEMKYFFLLFPNFPLALA